MKKLVIICFALFSFTFNAFAQTPRLMPIDSAFLAQAYGVNINDVIIRVVPVKEVKSDIKRKEKEGIAYQASFDGRKWVSGDVFSKTDKVLMCRVNGEAVIFKNLTTGMFTLPVEGPTRAMQAQNHPTQNRQRQGGGFLAGMAQAVGNAFLNGQGQGGWGQNPYIPNDAGFGGGKVVQSGGQGPAYRQ